MLIKQAIRKKPALIAQKLTHTWLRGDNYLEIDCDVSSSKLASMLCGSCQRIAKKFVIDLAFLIEGQNADELPERVLGNIRLYRPDMSNLPVFDPIGPMPA